MFIKHMLYSDNIQTTLYLFYLYLFTFQNNSEKQEPRYKKQEKELD